jgi:CDP-diacylglycerol--glycerol-3-phosphate 3-phosphatidyltransferase
VNLPTAITVGRIIATPFIAALPFFANSTARQTAFVLLLSAFVTDWLDGFLARKYKEETDVGKMLDPLADKLLLFGTLAPMYWLAREMPFRTPFGSFGLPLWVVVVVVGREVFMTWFRQYAWRRGVVIGASWTGKWKAGVGSFWQGAAYCWFWALTIAAENGTTLADTHWATVSLGLIGAAAMSLAVALSLFSMFQYLRDYGKVLGTRPK